jgi:hypothetical protein
LKTIIPRIATPANAPLYMLRAQFEGSRVWLGASIADHSLIPRAQEFYMMAT